MSQHKDNDPIRLELALRINNLPVNEPSQLADVFRNGWFAHIRDQTKTITELDRKSVV